MTTVKALTDSVVAEIKFNIEQDVECVTYVRLPMLRLMRCTMHMKNSFMIEGDAVLLSGGDEHNARDMARKAALKKLILIEQYLLADKWYFDVVFKV